MSDVKYPEIEVRLTGVDGNAFAIIGAVARAMRKAGLTSDEVSEFQKEAMSGDYNHVLQTAVRFVEVS